MDYYALVHLSSSCLCNHYTEAYLLRLQTFSGQVFSIDLSAVYILLTKVPYEHRLGVASERDYGYDLY